MAFEVKKAKREKTKAKIGVMGTSGAGKTVGALWLAYGLSGNDWSKVCVIDTERSRSLLYADRNDLVYEIGEFLHIDLQPPYSVDRYIEAMKVAQEAVGSDGVIIIDSASHCWFAEGGVLDYKEHVESLRGKTSFSSWNDAGKLQNKFVDSILALDCHVICTLRSKTEYVQEKDPETNKTTIKKLGLVPVQRDNFEFELNLMLDLDKDTHIASIIKDNTFLEAEGFQDVLTPELGTRLRDWLNNASQPEVYKCECCGKVIRASEGKNGILTPKQIVENSKNMFDKQMCLDCVKIENKKIKEQKEKENQQ